MKHFLRLSCCLVLMASCLAADQADAGSWWKRSKQKRTEKGAEQLQPRRFEDHPPMRFKGGILQYEPHAGWKIGNTPLYLTSDCVITSADSDRAQLLAGRQAVVMGPMAGGAILAWSIHISAPAYQSLGSSYSGETKSRGADPDVGSIDRRIE